MDAEARLRALGLQLPPAPRPVATYVMTTLVGNLLFVAGHTPRNPDGSPGHQGKVGRDLTVAQGQAAARVVALNTLASVRQAVGSLNRVVRLVRTFGMVNATSDFGDHPQVMNGFSDLIVQIFGETAGRGTRAAVGMGSLPSGMSVEVETVWEVRA
ncbi:MAG: RidA family protein [Gemmatimonadetes bacterium]|nr:RidA family protein [Gemmatimonadota bacterium]